MKSNSFNRKAIALKYDAQLNSAPVVKAKGIGEVADKIIKIAKENGIPIKEDTDLTELLMQIELNEEIPPELYKVVAEIFAYVYRLNKLKNYEGV
ncbi:MAG: EscU/YscU/HrcU family type III secretion system export apparatus switch protein [Candidatus Poribacteria bacterium]